MFGVNLLQNKSSFSWYPPAVKGNTLTTGGRNILEGISSLKDMTIQMNYSYLNSSWVIVVNETAIDTVSKWTDSFPLCPLLATPIQFCKQCATVLQ